MTDKLTTEDYENIYLRIKEKTKWSTIRWTTFIFGLTAFAVYFGVGQFMKDKAQSEISNLVKSKEFKEALLDSLNSRMVSVDAHYKEIIGRLSRYEKLRSAPYSSGSNWFSFAETNGTQLIVEYGEGRPDEEIEFKNKFHGPPRLFLSPVIHSQQAAFSSRIPVLTISTLTDHGFTVGKSRTGSFTSITFNWVVIGK